MIVRMSKVKIAGPKELLESTLSLLSERGVLHIERGTFGFIDKSEERHISSYIPDAKTVTERLFLEELRSQIDELLSYLPDTETRKSYIEPPRIMDTINKTLKRNLAICRERAQRKQSLQEEREELNRYSRLLKTFEALLVGVTEAPDLEFIGIMLKEPGTLTRLREALTRLTGGTYEILTETAPDGTLAVLVMMEKDMAEKTRKILGDVDFPELKFPAALRNLSFAEKIAHIQSMLPDISAEVRSIERDMEVFSRRWGPIYKRVRQWVIERLAVLKATASVFETRMCFFILGWVPADDVAELQETLTEHYGGRIVIQQETILEEDTEQVPVMLKNPPYFQPFELFTRLLPLPKYTSYDPTPFIGIFFPIFFGMILGDAGYGLVLLLLSVILKRRFRKRTKLEHAAKILLVSSFYTVLFGVLYGEFFGELGHRMFGLSALYVDRRTALIPMLFFALTIGVVHVLLGFVLGFVNALKRKTRREAAYKFLTFLFIICIVMLVGCLFELFPHLLTRPIIIAILVLTPLLLFTGGLLAPLELLKSVGNIVSYTRIMAIGLTSVLLAFVANRLAGLTGDIVIGIVVAGLFHLLNILLGVFSPTIHSVRLHYVEFFSKFLEHGGRKFTPLEKER